ncbi:DUF3024 domain-containing protein [Actinomycetospora chibensis]
MVRGTPGRRGGRVTVTPVEVPDEHRALVRQWCARRVPEAQRDSLRISYTERAGRITISVRRAPVFPELGTNWTTEPLAQLRLVPDEDRWILLWPDSSGRWHRYPDETKAGSPAPLLDIIDADPTGIFWG